MQTDLYQYDGENPFSIQKAATDEKGGFANKRESKEIVSKNLKKMEELQGRLYAEARSALLIVFQAMDAAGKDSAVKHVFSGLNPQGVQVYSFKQPSEEELMHDYIWRTSNKIPRRGMITIFNRSYYESVLVEKVHKLYQNENLPQRCLDQDVIAMRYGQIKNFEQYLWDNGIHIVKFFLHVSKDEQKERLLARIENPAKNWKFSKDDLLERQYWDDYQDAYEVAINKTATKQCPWYVVPSDHKWFAHAVISEVLAKTLEEINPQYPQLSDDAAENLQNYKKILNG